MLLHLWSRISLLTSLQYLPITPYKFANAAKNESFKKIRPAFENPNYCSLGRTSRTGLAVDGGRDMRAIPRPRRDHVVTDRRLLHGLPRLQKVIAPFSPDLLLTSALYPQGSYPICETLS